MAHVIARLNVVAIDSLVGQLFALRERGGRLFVLGVGGSAANASHAVNDLRKLCGIEAYAPTDNIAELTARTNDEGWESVFASWLEGSHLEHYDCVLILSVGGGSSSASPNIVKALEFAQARGAHILGIVGRDGGETAKRAECCLIVPTGHPQRVTPHTESAQSILLHLIVSHPELQQRKAKWESLTSV